MGKKGSGSNGNRAAADARNVGGASPSVRATVFPFAAAELLSKGLAALGMAVENSVYRTVGIRGTREAIPLFERYIRELELFNAVFDLVGAETGSDQGRSDLVVRHILDSLAPWKEIAGELSLRRLDVCPDDPFLAAKAGDSGRPTLADAGSGAGFPGIPLAIVFPGIQVTLIERMSKRCAFLENCVAMLALKNVTILNSEVEKASSGAYDVVAFRAFRPLDQAMIRTLLALPRAGGCLAAWKAKKERILDEMNAIAGEVGHWEIRPLEVPFLEHEERNLVLMEGKALSGV